MTKLLMIICLATLGCKASAAVTSRSDDAIAPAPNAQGIQPEMSRNLALDHVMSEEPGAKCTIYYHHAGQLLTDSVKCVLPDKTRVYAQVDTVNGIVIKRTSPPTKEEIEAMKAQQAQQTQQAPPLAEQPPPVERPDPPKPPAFKPPPKK